jgi:DNA-binding transcriptional LysR family regulator
LTLAAAAVAPGVKLTFSTVSRPIDLEDHLRDGVVDIAIDWIPSALAPFINTKIFDDRPVLSARGDHPSARADMAIDDLRQESFVTPHRRRNIEHLPEALREFYKLELPEEIRVDEPLEIPVVVARSDLLGLFSLSMAPLMKQLLGLQIVPIPLELPTLPIYVVWHESRRNDAAHRWLRELVSAKLGSLEPTA